MKDWVIEISGKYLKTTKKQRGKNTLTLYDWVTDIKQADRFYENHAKRLASIDYKNDSGKAVCMTDVLEEVAE